MDSLLNLSSKFQISFLLLGKKNLNLGALEVDGNEETLYRVSNNKQNNSIVSLISFQGKQSMVWGVRCLPSRRAHFSREFGQTLESHKRGNM